MFLYYLQTRIFLILSIRSHLFKPIILILNYNIPGLLRKCFTGLCVPFYMPFRCFHQFLSNSFKSNNSLKFAKKPDPKFNFCVWLANSNLSYFSVPVSYFNIDIFHLIIGLTLAFIFILIFRFLHRFHCILQADFMGHHIQNSL